jgi:DNA polymerase-3 subunit alpha
MTKEQSKLYKYCKEMLLDFKIEEDLFTIAELKYLILEEGVLLVNSEGDFNCSAVDMRKDIDGFVYEFGGRWYTQGKQPDLQLKEVKYIGNSNENLPTKSFLGIRSGYELMNGIGLYKDWIAKAKFLGIQTLGICEKNTLGGVLAFQIKCKEVGIKPIVGMTIQVQGLETYGVKVYAKNFQGWLNLLKMSTIINVDQNLNVSEEVFKESLEGLFLVVDPKNTSYCQADQIREFVDFYQLDTVNFLNREKDDWYIDNLEKFIKSDLDPISITDAFYLESVDFRTREAMWTVNKAFDDRTDNQYFKSKSQYAKELVVMFEEGNKSWVPLFKQAVANESLLIDGCTFEYDTDTRHLPRYIMSEEESANFNTNEELFLHIVKKGFKDRNINDPQRYIARLKKEIAVLKMGDVIDYFLSLHDIIAYAKRQKMLTGIGRGSAGGSLVAYLMGIIQVDPLRFDLLFERFLNEGRMGRFEDRPSFKITQEDGSVIEFEEGSLVRIKRNNKETVVFVHELVEGDDIIIY